MRSALALLTITAAACANAQPHVTGSGHPATDARAVGAFSSIEARGAETVHVTIGATTAVTVTGDDNVVPLIRTERHGDTLVIDHRGSFSAKVPIVVDVTVPALTRFELHGSGTVAIDRVHGTPLAIALDGSGPIAVSGDSPALTAELSGAGRLDARALTATRATVTLSGSGSAEVTATDTLTADVSGSGSVHFGGNPPHVERHVSGSGTIRAR